jgi:micrococcal nuclease
MSTPAAYCYPIELVSVYDGDTVTANVDVGFGWRKTKLKCRLFGIDTPEIRGSSKEEKVLAYAAKAFLKELLEGADEVILNSVAKPDKYGRCLAVLWADGVDVSDLMIKEGHARPYDGGTKSSWVTK